MESRILLIILLFFSNFLYANIINVNVNLSDTDIIIGDTLTYNLKVTFNKKNNPDNIDFSPSKIGEFEILSHNNSKKENKDKITYFFNYNLIAFNNGLITIPALPIRFKYKKNNDWNIIFSDTKTIMVNNIKTDVKKGVKDIFGPLKLPFIFVYWWIIVLILLIILFFIFFYYKYKKRKKDYYNLYENKIDVYDLVRKKFVELEEKKLGSFKDLKMFSFSLSEIIKLYFSDRLKINLTDMTTYEIKHKIKNIELQMKSDILNILDYLDMIKFANYQPKQITDIRNKISEAEKIIIQNEQYFKKLIEEKEINEKTKKVNSDKEDISNVENQ